VDFCTKIKFGGRLAIRGFWPSERIWREKVRFDAAEILDWHGFRATDLQSLVFKELRYENPENKRLGLA
jgi:hypothetical protein